MYDLKVLTNIHEVCSAVMWIRGVAGPALLPQYVRLRQNCNLPNISQMLASAVIYENENALALTQLHSTNHLSSQTLSCWQ